MYKLCTIFPKDKSLGAENTNLWCWNNWIKQSQDTFFHVNHQMDETLQASIIF